MIAIVDTGGANVASIRFAFERLGRPSRLTSDAAEIARASHVVLPGVGSAGSSMRRLGQLGLARVLCKLEQPVLGICLGMQLLFERSDEGDAACLGVLPGVVSAIESNPALGVTVPHMGWNRIERTGGESRLFDPVDRTYMYFVHSYRAPAGVSTRATTDHGGAVVAAVEHGNFFGVQFHPERSADAGAALLERFATL